MESQKPAPQLLTTGIKLVNDKIHFMGQAKNHTPISIDYSAPIGDDLGYTSLELLLLSLSSCVGSALALLLRKMGKTLSGLEITALGVRRTEHPTCFEKITLEIRIGSDDVTAPAVDRALALSEESICPVWAMVKNNVEVVTQYSLLKTGETAEALA